MKKMMVKITFTEEVLGSSCPDPDVYIKYIGSKSGDTTKIAEEAAAIQTDDEQVENKMTVFPRNPDGKPCAWDYQIRGFFKDACGMLRNVPDSECAKIKSHKKAVDGLIFVEPRMIPFEFEGEMGICQRPLRAMTMQGERVALAMSETIPAGATLTFEITLFNENLYKMVIECLEYGKYRGFSQWRNSGKGRFTYEILDI